MTSISRKVKFTKGRRMINTKHVLIMCSSYPLVTPTSFYALAVSCLMGNLKKHVRWLCRKSTNGNEVANNPPTQTFMSNLLWLMGFRTYVRIMVWCLNGWNRGKWVCWLTEQERLLSGQTYGQNGNPLPCNRRETQENKNKPITSNLSLVCDFSEAIYTDIIKLKHEKWLL